MITIDGTEVIKDSVSAWDGSGESSGEYRGEKIAVSCNYIMKVLSSYEQCMVFVGSERAAALQF